LKSSQERENNLKMPKSVIRDSPVVGVSISPLSMIWGTLLMFCHLIIQTLISGFH